MATKIYYERNYWWFIGAILGILLIYLIAPSTYHDANGEWLSDNLVIAVIISGCIALFGIFLPFLLQEKVKIEGTKYRYISKEEEPKEENDYNWVEEREEIKNG